jgi:iron complex outermembrane receptor protein
MKHAGALRGSALFFSASALAIAAAPLAAQDASDDPAAERSNVIIVTAQKREQDIRDVPVSVATVSPETLDTVLSAGADVLALSGRVPSLYAETSNGRVAPRFYIRGLGNIAFDANASQPVSVVYDDVVLENVSAKAFPIFDTQAVEVLRGPQGTLFGRNTPAGVVKITSVRPSEETDGYVAASFGRFNFRTLEGALGGAIAPGVLSARLSFQYQGQDDWVDNTTVGLEEENALGGFDEIAARLQLLFTPGDDTDILLNFGYQDLSDATPPLFRAGLIGRGGRLIEQDRSRISHDTPGFAALEQWNFTGTIEHDFGDVTLTSVTGYRAITGNSNQGDVDGGALTGPNFPGNVPFLRDVVGLGDNWALTTGDNIADHEQFTQEIRLNGQSDTVNWTVGGYYFFEDVAIDQLSTASFSAFFGGYPLPAPILTAQQFQETEAWAVFGSVEVAATDRLTAQLGLRYSDEQKDFSVVYPTANTNPVGGQTFLVDVQDDEVTGDFSLTYEVSPYTNIYGRVARGFRAPSILARDSVPDVGDSETIWSYEAGVKTESEDGRFRTNAALYYFDLSDQQLPVVGGVTNTIGLVNAESTIGYGAELDMQWDVSDFVQWTAGISWNETEINDPNLSIQACGAACVVNDPADPANPGFFFIDGNTLPNAPEWILSTTLRVSQPAFGGELFLFTDWFYRSEVELTLYDSNEFESEANVEGGVRVGYQDGDGDWELSAFVRNITNSRALVAALDFFDFNSQTFTGTLNEPRTFGVEVRRRF